MIYLDFAGSGLPHPSMAARLTEYLSVHSINPHGGSCFAENSRRAVLTAQRRLLHCLNLTEREANVIWTSGCTEALNLAISGFLDKHGGIDNIIVDGGAHPAMMQPCLQAAKTQHRRVTVTKLSKAGQLQIPADTSPPTLQAVCHVNNETGAVQDLVRIRETWPNQQQQRPVLIVDAAQSFGRVNIPWQEAQIDMLTLSGRKLGGPAAVGALICRPETNLRPLLLGGGQQRGWRSGTLDTVGILLFVDAVEAACREQAAACKLARELSEQLWYGLATGGFPAWQRLSPVDCVPHLASWSFPGYEGAVLMRALAQEHGILIAAGSACAAESKQTSHVLQAMGYEQKIARGALRVSFGPASKPQEVAALLQALQTVLKNY